MPSTTSQDLKTKTRSLESEETESDAEVLTAEQILESQNFKIGTVKKAAPAAKDKPKKYGEMVKRLVVGFAVMAWYVSAMYIHPLLVQLVTCCVAIFMHGEVYNITRKPFEEQTDSPIFRFVLSSAFFYLVLPKFGMLERSIVERSGFSAKDHPLVFEILYERHSLICMVLFSLLFITAVSRWRSRNIRYQLRKSVATVLGLFYCTLASCVQGYSFIYGGRWWLCFATLSVSMNDTSAYFAGVFTGRHHLIGLSPNKTIEGFIGGLVGNIGVTYFVTQRKLQGDFWQCAPKHFNYGLFEEFHCEEYSPIYTEQEYQLPFPMMGLTSFTVKPAVVYSIVIALYASLAAPYLGFFASGFKRATGIKDFAATLPGHGGFIDRADCITLMSIFTYLYLRQVVFRSDFDRSETLESVEQLDDVDKLKVISSIGQSLGLPSI